MEILENQAQWIEHFKNGWLANLNETGTVSWEGYQHPRNEQVPGTSGVNLCESRLMLVTSTGAYLRDSQEPFDAESLYGDYSARTWPSSTAFDALDYAHDHYDQTMIRQDAQVALPLRYLEEMVAAGQLGDIAPSVFSFMGYQPDSAAVVEHIVPQAVAVAKREKVDAALLAPV
ncbi:MAG: hypothetical protein D6737_18245 [Chloroflexi bacterium]|nr:MAG: hypothetical protein D6737_18245 [Chloroflexota bacterium]